jgi:murein DD-endopeptidase MepM/ murein hydrolase activator NlpD
MEDVVVKPRYPRNTPRSRKKRIRAKDSSGLGETIKIQLLISVLIFVIISCTKIINTPATNFITDKIKWVLSWDMNISDIYEQFNGMITGGDKLSDASSEGAVKGNVKGNGEGNIIEENIEENATGENITEANKEEGNKAGENEAGKSKEEDLHENGHVARLEFVLPVEGPIASYFGEIIDPATNTVSFHSGIDIEGHGILDVRAVEDGEVLEVSESRDYGKYLKIRHAGGIISLYAHCSKIFVKEGAKISKGDIIAEIGNDRLSIGTHLHFEVWKDDKPVDPLEFLEFTEVPMKLSSS